MFHLEYGGNRWQWKAEVFEWGKSEVLRAVIEF